MIFVARILKYFVLNLKDFSVSYIPPTLQLSNSPKNKLYLEGK